MDVQSPSSSTVQPLQLPGKLLVALVLLLFALAGAWLVAGFVSLGLLAQAVPLLESDLRDASWLGSPITALHFSTGPLGYGMCACFVMVGLAMAVAKRSPAPAVSGLVMAGALFFGASEEANVRVGLLDGTVRIGCFVPESSECRSMLKLSTLGTQSIYPSSGDTSEFSGWYRARRAETVPSDLNGRVLFTSIPGGALLRAPMYLASSEKLRQLVLAQRQAVAQLRVTHP